MNIKTAMVNPNLRSALLLSFYCGLAVFSYYLAYELRFDFSVPTSFADDRFDTIWWVTSLKLCMLSVSGQVQCLLAYFRLSDAISLFLGLLLTALLLVFMWLLCAGQGIPPRAVILSDLMISFFLIGAFRVLMRLQASRSWADWRMQKQSESILIVGAGEVGSGLCAELFNKASLGMRPVAFLDDDSAKIGRYVHGVRVVDSIDGLAQVARRYQVSKVIIAFPSASIQRLQQVIAMSRETGLRVERVPAIGDLLSGRAQISQLQPIEFSDFLGRKPIELDSDQIRILLRAKRVLVTGAGGSIGRELVKQVLDYRPAALHCLDRSEIAIFNLQQEIIMPVRGASSPVDCSVLDIADNGSVEALLQQFRPEVVFHAAAHKHLNLMEDQPAEALKNNFFATADLAASASRAAVEHFIFISTDKAVNPSSVMGASKRLAELALEAQQLQSANRTCFMSVRFGNVLGSSGSVVPIFRRQIAAGGPVTVTDPQVARFFMTVEEAVGLVLNSATQGTGGEIFVLDMGQAVKIVDVARQMIELSGLREGVDIEIQYTSLCPGEKLREELQHQNESLTATAHPRVLRFVAKHCASTEIESIRIKLECRISQDNANQLKLEMQEMLPEYTPYLS